MFNLIIMADLKKEGATSDFFLKGVVAVPARRSLAKEKINSLEQLSDYTENEILQMHGFGKNTMQKLKAFMNKHQFSFKME